jgi:hypothetical protein
MSTEPYDILSEDFANFALDEVEEFAELADRAQVPVTANGQVFKCLVLGFGSSYKDDDHSHVPGTVPVEKCPSCRWADIAILSVPMEDASGSTYVIALMGKSVVPGEKHRLKIVFTADPAKVFQNLFVPSRGPRSGPADKKIPIPNAVAFRRAARVDEGLDAVLIANEIVVPDPQPEGSYQDF